jgi:hypothetical protein
VRPLKLLGVVAVVLVSGLTGSPPAAFAHSQPWEKAYVQNVYSGHCLVVRGMELPAETYYCTARYGDQRWHLEKVQPGLPGVGHEYRIRNDYHPNVCLAVRGLEVGNAAVGVACDPNPDYVRWTDQVWHVIDLPGHSHSLQNYHSGLCLAAQGPDPIVARQFDCDFNVGTWWSDQHWNLWQPTCVQC